MNRQTEFDAIARDVMAALECARNGQSHGRLNQMMLRTIVKDTAFMPPCPESVLPIERRRFTADNPCPIYDNRGFNDFTDRIEIGHGVTKQE